MSKYQEALFTLVTNSSQFLKENKLEGSQFMEWHNKSKDLLQELVDKETPRKVLIKGTVIQCPKCFTIFPYVTGPLGPCVTSTEYCPDCGQHLDWSDDND